MSNKQSKHFELSIPMTESSSQSGAKRFYSLGDLTICGVAYFYPNEDHKNQIDYDIDQVFFSGKDIKPALEWLHGSLKETDEIHNPIVSFLQKMFRPDGYRTEDEEIEEERLAMIKPDLASDIQNILLSGVSSYKRIHGIT